MYQLMTNIMADSLISYRGLIGLELLDNKVEKVYPPNLMLNPYVVVEREVEVKVFLYPYSLSCLAGYL